MLAPAVLGADCDISQSVSRVTLCERRLIRNLVEIRRRARQIYVPDHGLNIVRHGAEIDCQLLEEFALFDVGG
jgi:hypothetical protein